MSDDFRVDTLAVRAGTERSQHGEHRAAHSRTSGVRIDRGPSLRGRMRPAKPQDGGGPGRFSARPAAGCDLDAADRAHGAPHAEIRAGADADSPALAGEDRVAAEERSLTELDAFGRALRVENALLVHQHARPDADPSRMPHDEAPSENDPRAASAEERRVEDASQRKAGRAGKPAREAGHELVPEDARPRDALAHHEIAIIGRGGGSRGARGRGASVQRLA